MEEQKIEQKKAAIRKLFADRPVRARYRIDVTISHKRHAHTLPVLVMLQAFTAGTQLDGGGDEKVYFCPIHATVIPPGNLSSVGGFCGKCGKIHRPGDLVGEYIYKLPLRTIAKRITSLFRRLSFSADVMIHYTKASLRAPYSNNLKMLPDKLAAVRATREPGIYPLARIVQDTASGKDLDACFLSFLAA